MGLHSAALLITHGGGSPEPRSSMTWSQPAVNKKAGASRRSMKRDLDLDWDMVEWPFTLWAKARTMPTGRVAQTLETTEFVSRAWVRPIARLQ